VEDSAEIIALYMAPGTTYTHPRTLEGDQVPRHLLADEWQLVDAVWHGGGALYLGRTGEPPMVIGFRDDENSKFERWYINLQDPLTRTTGGFNYLDMELDIEVEGDFSGWRWKDEDKFQELADKGVVSLQKADYLWSVGADVALRVGTVVARWVDWKPGGVPIRVT